MSLTIGSGFISVPTTWTVLKNLVYNKNMVLQYVDDGYTYTLFALDSVVIYIATLHKGGVPYGSGLDQTDNDSDVTDFETYYKATANQSITPRATDGRVNLLPNIFPTNTQVCFTGSGDDPTNGVGQGTIFNSSSNDTSPTDHSVEWNFNDPVYVAGGSINYTNAIAGDTMSYYLFAAANTTTSTAGAGNCDYGTGGDTGKLVPNQATTGARTVNLTTAIPVPNLLGTGWWDWTCPSGVGKGTITPNYTHTGTYDLYTVQIKLANLLLNVPMLGTLWSKFSIPAVVPKKVLPQWTHHVTIHNVGTALVGHQLTCVWYVMLARVKTT